MELYHRNDRYLFICGMVSSDDPAAVEMTSVDVSANTLSSLFYSGLTANIDSPVDVMRDRYGLLYPLLPAVVKKRMQCNADGSVHITVPYVNRNKTLKMVSKTLSMTLETITWAVKNRKTGRGIIVYSLHFPYIVSALVSSVFLRKAGLFVIIPDLPMFMDPELRRKKLKFLIKMFENFLYRGLLKFFNGFVVLSGDTARWLKRNREKIFVIQGMVSSSEAEEALQRVRNVERNRYILYSGSLEERYGIKDLLDAFALADIDNCSLFICGDGNYREEIIKKCRTSSRIRYLGSLPRTEVLELQRKALLLVNPRASYGDFTRYSFPSKTMEYLLSGSPVLMRPLPGIVPEFEKLVFLDTGQTVESLAEKMRDILAMPAESIQKKTSRAVEFIASRKTEVALTSAFCNYILVQTHNKGYKYV